MSAVARGTTPKGFSSLRLSISTRPSKAFIESFPSTVISPLT